MISAVYDIPGRHSRKLFMTEKAEEPCSISKTMPVFQALQTFHVMHVFYSLKTLIYKVVILLCQHQSLMFAFTAPSGLLRKEREADTDFPRDEQIGVIYMHTFSESSVPPHLVSHDRCSRTKLNVSEKMPEPPEISVNLLCARSHSPTFSLHIIAVL